MWPGLLLAACVGAGSGEPPRAPHAPVEAVAPGAEVTSAVLMPSGKVQAAGEEFNLLIPEEAAELGRALARSSGSGALRIEGVRGTPMAHVRRLMAVLEAAGLEEYRLDLGR